MLGIKSFAAALIAVAAMLAPSAVFAGTAGGTTATQFTASYGPFGPPFIHFDCSGVHIVNANSGMVKDTETCLLTGDTSGLVAGTYKGDPYGVSPLSTQPTRWASDFDEAIATHWTLTLVDNGDGTWSLSAVAYY